MSKFDDPGKGNRIEVRFPHSEYLAVIKLITSAYRISRNDWLLMVIQAGIMSAAEDSPEMSEMVRRVAPELWKEVQEVGPRESGTMAEES